jgi:hypothetical protein
VAVQRQSRGNDCRRSSCLRTSRVTPSSPSFSPVLAAGAQSPIGQSIIANPKFQAAQDFVAKDHDRFIREIIQITETEAPPFKEEKRAKLFAEMLRQSGLSDVEIDAEGNVIGVRKGNGGPLIAIRRPSRHCFPRMTNVKVRREGTRLYAPGVGDDSRALAVLLAIIRALDAAKIQTGSDILFIGNVGEEGPGDLRGMKYLFQRGPYKDRIKMFISLDPYGSGNDVTVGGIGSKRFKVTFKGPWRTQFRIVRTGEPCVRSGERDDEVIAHAGSFQTEDDFQCRRDRRRHVGEFDSIRILDGCRYSVRNKRRTE